MKKVYTVFSLLRGSWDLVTRVIIKVTILITPLRVLITVLTKSHEPPSGYLKAQFMPQTRRTARLSNELICSRSGSDRSFRGDFSSPAPLNKRLSGFSLCPKGS